MAAAIYRLSQGLRAIFAFATPLDDSLPRQVLSRKEYAEFCRLSRAERLHSVKVLRQVFAQDETTPQSLAKAALLHDVGKSRHPLSTAQKSLKVITRKLAPCLAARLAHGDSLSWWRAPFVVSARHPQWSAEILRACGSDPLVIWLTENHQRRDIARDSQPNADLLRRLQAADDAC